MFPSGHSPATVYCGSDASIVVTKAGRVLATGNNKLVHMCNLYIVCIFCCYSYNKLALNGTFPETITEDNGLAGHLHLSHNNTVIRNVPLEPNVSSSKLFSSSMSSSILSSSLKLARKLLEENGGASVDADKKDDSSSSHDEVVECSTTHDVVKDTKTVPETQQKEKAGDTGKCLPVVHHVDRFRPITFKLLMQEQVTAVSMGTLHTVFVTGRCAVPYTHTLMMTHLFSLRKVYYHGVQH